MRLFEKSHFRVQEKNTLRSSVADMIVELKSNFVYDATYATPIRSPCDVIRIFFARYSVKGFLDVGISDVEIIFTNARRVCVIETFPFEIESAAWTSDTKRFTLPRNQMQHPSFDRIVKFFFPVTWT